MADNYRGMLKAYDEATQTWKPLLRTIVNLYDGLDSESSDLALTAKQGKALNEKIEANNQSATQRADSLEETLNAKPNIYKGTSFVAPEGWKDGDLFVVYEA